MLILSVGMPRAGSGWHYNLIHDLVISAGGQESREVRRRYRLGAFLSEVNCNIGTLAAYRLLPVLIPSLLGNSFAIKLHGGPRPLARWLTRVGLMRATYIYRDPRAALLSAYEYGQRGGSGFWQLKSIEQAIEFMLPYLEIWEQWKAEPKTLQVRYEDLLSGYQAEIERLLTHLAIPATNAGVQAVVDKYRPGQSTSADQGLHFHKGRPQRFREVLSRAQLEAANQACGGYLTRMGYPAK